MVSKTPPRHTVPSYRATVVGGATVATLLVIIFVVRDLARQPVLVTSLASSTSLLYYQPANEVNRFRPCRSQGIREVKDEIGRGIMEAFEWKAL